MLTIKRPLTPTAPITHLTRHLLLNSWSSTASTEQQGVSWRADGIFSGRLNGGSVKGKTIVDAIYFSGTLHEYVF